MGQLKELSEAFLIMSKYDDGSYSLCTEHDEIWAGHDIEIKSVSEEDMNKLEELGWSPSAEGGFYRYV